MLPATHGTPACTDEQLTTPCTGVTFSTNTLPSVCITFCNQWLQLVSCLYVRPKNLALGCSARQSSVYDGLGAEIVVDGDRSGDDPRRCNCTQQDPQGWWEVDLGELVHVHQVKVFFNFRRTYFNVVASVFINSLCATAVAA